MENNQSTGTPESLQKHRIGLAVFIGLAIPLTVLAYFLLYWQYKISREDLLLENTNVSTNSTVEQNNENASASLDNKPTISTKEDGVVSSGADSFGKYYLVQQPYSTTTLKDYSIQFANDDFEVKWNRGAKIVPKEKVAAILKQIDPTAQATQLLFSTDTYGEIYECTQPSTDPKCQIYLYELGTLVSPQALASKPIYLLIIPADQPFGYSNYQMLVVFDDTSHKFVRLENKADLYQPPFNIFAGYIRVGFPELNVPDIIKVSDTLTTSTLLFVKNYGTLPRIPEYATENRGGIINIYTGEVVLYDRITSSPVRFTNAMGGTREYGPVYKVDNGYAIILPDGSVQMYDLLPSFLTRRTPIDAVKNFYPADYDAHITWTDGRTNTNDTYILGGTIGGLGMCSVGVLPCTNIINKESWFTEKDLVEVGKTNAYDPVFEIKDATNNPMYKKLFDFGYVGWQITSGGKTFEEVQAVTSSEQYKDFLADHPIFFWKDVDGNWRVYQKYHYQPAVECGKPVIYLYPEKETTVKVAVAPAGGLTKTEPAYGTSGWTVTAKPDGTIINSNDNRTYPYLFWEGRALNYTRPEQGFVMKQADVPAVMRALLAKQGLSDKEINGFMEFWQPRLEVKPYVFVTFVPQTEFDHMAPLTVSPRPDTVIRVFMGYEPLDNPVQVMPQEIRTPERVGFTVVEWGGALGR